MLRKRTGSKLPKTALLSIMLLMLVLGACNSESTKTSEPVATFALPTPPGLNNSITIQPDPTATPGPTRDPNTPVVVKVDQTKALHPISPYIYGIGWSPDKNVAYYASLRPTLVRWGGNFSSRYNWVRGNAWNTGRQGQFLNTSFGLPTPYGQPRYVFNDMVQQNVQQNIASLITIPMLGWVARDDSGFRSLDVPPNGAPALNPQSEAIAGYDPTANRLATSVESKARKGAPFTLSPKFDSTVIYQDEWVNYLVNKYGAAKQGGVKFYGMDNEADLWSANHTDVHPAQMGYDSMRDKFLEYAEAVKAVDPTAMVSGPVVSGWTSYFWSELDRGTDNFRTTADRRAHGNQPFIPWFLDQVRRADEKNGRRSLDILDIHYFPQGAGIGDNKTDAATNALRLRSTRALWDKSYVDESWIRQTVAAIPLMQSWIKATYPGTLLAISGWNWGADTSLNGALAIANVLGVFGREDVYMASYWQNPPADSPGFYAFKLFTNFDNNGTNFGDQALSTVSGEYQNVVSFAALDSKTNRMRIMLINNQPTNDRNIEIQLAKDIPAQAAKVYELSSRTDNKIGTQPALNVNGTTVKLKLPGYSIILVDVQL